MTKVLVLILGVCLTCNAYSQNKKSQFTEMLSIEKGTYKFFYETGDVMAYGTEIEIIPNIENEKVISLRYDGDLFKPENEFFPRYFRGPYGNMAFIEGKIYIWNEQIGK